MPLFASAQKKPKGDFVHHVYFWHHSSDSEEDKAKLIEGLKTIKQIDTHECYGFLRNSIGG